MRRLVTRSCRTAVRHSGRDCGRRGLFASRQNYSYAAQEIEHEPAADELFDTLGNTDLHGRSALPRGKEHSVAGSTSLRIGMGAPRRFVQLQPFEPSGKGAPAKRDTNTRTRTEEEALALFDACLATGNIARSVMLLRQIKIKSNKDSLLRAVNQYLKHLVEQAEKSHSITVAKTLFDEYTSTWEITPDAYAHALMCRASLALKDSIAQKSAIHDVVKSWRSYSGDFGEILVSPALESVSQAQEIFNLSGLDYRMIGEESRAHLQTPPHPLRRVMEVRPTNQKGIGLKVVKQSLNVLTDENLHLSIPTGATPQTQDEQDEFNIMRQRKLEEDALDAAVVRWRHDHEELKKRGGLSYDRSLNAMFWQWKELIVPLIEEELARVDHKAVDGWVPRDRPSETEGTGPTLDEREADLQLLKEKLNNASGQRTRREYGPFLGLLKPEKLAAIAILELVRILSTDGADTMKTGNITSSIGRAIESEYHSEILKMKSSQKLFSSTYRDAISSPKLFSMSVREARANAAKQADDGAFAPEWSSGVKAQLGALLLSFVMYAARLEVTVTDSSGKTHTQHMPVFHHTYNFVRGSRIGVIKINEQFRQRLAAEPLTGSIYPRQLPMLIPPRPWYSWDSGGYLLSKSIAMRIKNCPEQMKYLREASKRNYMPKVLMALDVLGHTPWKVNERVFQCALEAWNTGEAFGDIPPAFTKVNLPDEPAPDADPSERFKYVKQVREAGNIVKNFASLRSDMNYKLEIARAFIDETMYFPHSLDFRGRAYPIPPHLNHLGNDLCRGLLKFATAKPLGQAGLRWLKIHLANQCGLDKASFAEREAFADENIEKVFEANDHPMDGTRWWLKRDKPWQCLATCFELTAALRSEDPTKFMSSMPVHQDGTCNGLQHYAALGGDFVGAEQVNLRPSERPQDVYKGVANLVAAQVKKDAQNGNKWAKILDGHVSRKLVKQPVMTNVYGVTVIGARLQVEKQLRDIEALSAENHYGLSAYIVIHIFTALKSMFNGAHEIQDWLRRSAAVISKSVHYDALINEQPAAMTTVIWTSPLDLPIVQPYRKVPRRQVDTNLQTVSLSDPSEKATVSATKQTSAFAPNYIHSLDATHMLMSAIACKEAGITFAAVHDSYWTHAADTDIMNGVLRDAFVELHTQDLMAELKTEFEKRHKNHYFPVKFAQSHGPLQYAIKEEHISSGKVLMLKTFRSLIIKDPALAQEVLHWDESEHLDFMKPPLVRRKAVRASSRSRSRSRSSFKDSPESLNQTAAQVVNEEAEEAMQETMRETLSETMAAKDALEEDIEDREASIVMEEDVSDVSETPQMTGSIKQSTRKKKQRAILWTVWVPLTFPQLPKKGGFNVEVVKESPYFFS